MAIPEPWGSRLRTYRASAGDEMAHRIPTHITLVPPFEPEDDDLSLVEKHLEAVAAEFAPFRVHLRGTGTFRPVSPVVFIALAEGIAQVEQLAAAVRSGPLALEPAFPFHPHVTVAHHLDDATLDRVFAEMAGFECEFEAADFHLYVHDEADGWQPSRSFDLVPPDDRDVDGED